MRGRIEEIVVMGLLDELMLMLEEEEKKIEDDNGVVLREI